MTRAAKSGFIEVNKGFPPMSAEPEFYLIICPAGALSSRIYFRICDHPSALLVSPCKLPRSWLKFMASPAFHFFSSTVKSSWENCSNWLALEGNENLLSGYCACHLNALDDISTPGNASSPPQSSRVVWCFFFSFPSGHWGFQQHWSLRTFFYTLYKPLSLNIFLQTESLQCATVF